MKAKELLALELEVLPPYVVHVNGQTVDSNRFPIGRGEDSPEGGRRFNSPLEYTGTKDEAEIMAMMPQMFRAIHGAVRNRAKAAKFKAAFPKEYQEFQRIVNAVMERCDMDVEMDHKKIVDNLRNSG